MGAKALLIVPQSKNILRTKANNYQEKDGKIKACTLNFYSAILL